MTTYTQDRAFIEEVVPTSLLEDAIAWMAARLDPDDVFNKETLEEWAERNGYVKKDD